MAQGSLSDFLGPIAQSISSLPSESCSTTPARPRPVLRHSSLADYFESQVQSYDNSTDNGLYMPTRVDVNKSLQQVDTAFTTPQHYEKRPTLPSYRAVHSRVGSFRERRTLVSDDYSSDVSKLRELEMRNEMMLAGRHNVLRTMKKQLRTDTQDKPKPTMTEQFQTRLQDRLRKLAHPGDTRKVWKCEGKKLFQKPTILKSREATLRTQSIASRRWGVKHCRAQTGSESAHSIAAKVLFQMLDFDNTERVNKDKLAWLLVALGVRLESPLIFLSLKAYFPSNPTSLLLSQWLAYVSDTSGLHTALQKLAPSNPPPHLSHSLSPPDQFLSLIDPEFTRLFEIWTQLHSAWKAIDPLATDSVSLDKAAHVLVSLDFAVEARSALKVIAKLARSATVIHKSEFLVYFIRPMVTLYLEAIEKALGLCFPECSLDMMGQRLTEVTRTVIMAGMEYRPEKCRYGKSVVERLKDFDRSQFENYAEYKKFIEEFLRPKKSDKTTNEPAMATTPSPHGIPSKPASPQPQKAKTPKRLSTAVDTSSSDYISVLNASTLPTTQSHLSSQQVSPSPGHTRYRVDTSPAEKHRRVRHTTKPPTAAYSARQSEVAWKSVQRSRVEDELSVEFEKFVNYVPYPSLSLFVP